MTRRSRVWLVVAVVFLVLNLVGAGMAVGGGELLHAGGHAGLALAGAYLAWRLASRRDAHRSWGGEESATAALSGDLTDRLTHLEQSLDAAAIEIERIGEGQRFMTRLFTENDGSPASGEGAAERIGIDAASEAPRVRHD